MPRAVEITAISDTHSSHKRCKLPGGDILIHAGDATFLGQPKEVTPFMEWMSVQPYKYKVFIAGNHDIGWEPIGEGINCMFTGKFDFRGMKLKKGLEEKYRKMAKRLGLIYLHDEEVTLDGIRIYGTPYQPEFQGWAFNLPKDGIKAKEIYRKIPEGIDVLVTHGPPWGIMDATLDPYENRCGCPVLLRRVLEVKPQYHIFGHIHEGYGEEHFEGITFLNVSTCQRDYKTFNGPVNFTIEPEER